MSATLQGLLAAYRSLAQAREDIVLATTVATDGSAYRKSGARMLFARDGRRFGMLAGGTFEDELFRHALPLFDGAAPAIVDMTSPGHGDAAARDTVRVLLQPLNAAGEYMPLALLARAVDRREREVLVTVCHSSDPRLPAGLCFFAGEARTQALPAEVVEELAGTAAEAAAAGEPLLVDHLYQDGEAEVFYAPIALPLSLLILGATPDVVPLAELAALLGWCTTIADARGDRRRANVPGGIEVRTLDAGALAVALDLEDVDAAVLLTRDFELDREYLRILAASPIPYLGLLGSKTRCDRMLASLGDDARRLQGRVHGPVGLDIGADTPEEIALAVAAEIQDEHRKRERAAATRSAPAVLPANVHALLLAAGGSRRFGGFKQLLEFRGESLLRRAARIASELLEGRVVVVHGPKPTKCQRELSGIDVAHAVNANWEGGVATSLRAGIRALPENCAAALVLLCDQPLIGADQIRALLGAWAAAPDRIAASAYADTVGVPAVIPRRYFPEVLQLSGDRGAKSVIEANAANVIAVAIPEAGLDIDTQDDYASMLMKSEGSGG